MQKLGALVIGQSPRPDVVAELEAVLGGGVEIHVKGALDGLSRALIDTLTPRSDADALFTHLPDGSDVTVSKQAVTEYGEQTLEAMVGQKYQAVVVMCTGAFPSWMARYPVIFPSLVLDGFVRALLCGGRLGVFVPIQEQVGPLGDRWRALGAEVHVECLTPTAGAEDIDAAAQSMGEQAPTLLVYDCLSYKLATKHRVEAVTKVPGVLAVSAAARAAAELLNVYH